MLHPLLVSAAIAGSVLTSTPAIIHAPVEPTPQVIFEFHTSTVEEASTSPVIALIRDVAEEYGISSTTLYNLAYSESNLNPDPPGHNDGGRAAGIVQIHYDVWGFTKEEVLDPEISLEFAAKHIKKGDAWKYWTPANCYTYVNNKLGGSLPPMSQIQPNTGLKPGVVAIFYYSGVKHIALVKSVSEGSFVVDEANYQPALIALRTVSKFDPHLVGYWSA